MSTQDLASSSHLIPPLASSGLCQRCFQYASLMYHHQHQHLAAITSGILPRSITTGIPAVTGAPTFGVPCPRHVHHLYSGDPSLLYSQPSLLSSSLSCHRLPPSRPESANINLIPPYHHQTMSQPTPPPPPSFTPAPPSATSFHHVIRPGSRIHHQQQPFLSSSYGAGSSLASVAPYDPPSSSITQMMPTYPSTYKLQQQQQQLPYPSSTDILDSHRHPFPSSTVSVSHFILLLLLFV